MSVYRIYVEKKHEHAVEAAKLYSELRDVLDIKGLTGLRLLNRYDTENLIYEQYQKCLNTVYSEPQLDMTYTVLPEAEHIFAVEYLPGQYDQRAASCEECIQLLCRCPRPTVKTARVYIIEGTLNIIDIQ